MAALVPNVLPQNYRNIGTGIAKLVSNLFSFIYTKTFLLIAVNTDLASALAVMSISCCCIIVFSAWETPETKGRTSDQVFARYFGEKCDEDECDFQTPFYGSIR